MKCICDHVFENPKNIRPWPDYCCLLGECPECKTSVIFINDNGKFRRMSREELKIRIENSLGEE